MENRDLYLIPFPKPPAKLFLSRNFSNFYCFICGDSRYTTRIRKDVLVCQAHQPPTADIGRSGCTNCGDAMLCPASLV
ncbi:MAG: hypothetical protein WCP80_10510, partial [Phycisphaerales bacterium]